MKKVLSILTAALVSATFFISCTKSTDSGTASLDLSTMINSQKEYQYSAVEWESNAETVKKALAYEVEEAAGTPADGTDITAIYKSKGTLDLGGQKATASFEFNQDKLQMVKFDFNLSDDYDTWFSTQSAELTKLYGQCTDDVYSENGGMVSKGYKWETSKTTLQILLVTGENSSPAATIGVGLKQ